MPTKLLCKEKKNLYRRDGRMDVMSNLLSNGWYLHPVVIYFTLMVLSSQKISIISIRPDGVCTKVLEYKRRTAKHHTDKTPINKPHLLTKHLLSKDLRIKRLTDLLSGVWTKDLLTKNF